MAQQTVMKQGASVRVACLAFGISQTCYRYQAKQSAENVEIADHLVYSKIGARRFYCRRYQSSSAPKTVMKKLNA
jgi:hypothetical protein